MALQNPEQKLNQKHQIDGDDYDSRNWNENIQQQLAQMDPHN